MEEEKPIGLNGSWLWSGLTFGSRVILFLAFGIIVYLLLSPPKMYYRLFNDLNGIITKAAVPIGRGTLYPVGHNSKPGNPDKEGIVWWVDERKAFEEGIGTDYGRLFGECGLVLGAAALLIALTRRAGGVESRSQAATPSAEQAPNAQAGSSPVSSRPWMPHGSKTV